MVVTTTNTMATQIQKEHRHECPILTQTTMVREATRISLIDSS